MSPSDPNLHPIMQRVFAPHMPEAAPASDIKHGKWTLRYDPPPIPVRNMDWSFTHQDYDASYEGEEDGYVSNGLGGRAESIEACKREIAEIEEDRGMALTEATS